MNKLKKKWLDLYTTLTVYKKVYRLKSGILAGITGLCACNVPLENSSLEAIDAKEKISQTVEDKEDYYAVLEQILSSGNTTPTNSDLFNAIDRALNFTTKYGDNVQNLLKTVLNESQCTKVKEKRDNLWIELQNEDNNQFLQIISYDNFTSSINKDRLIIVMNDSSDLTYESELIISVDENQSIYISLRFFDQKGNILNYPCIYQICYTEKSKNLVMISSEPVIAEDGKVTYGENGMNYNVTGSEYMTFKSIVESFLNSLSFEETRNILKDYILNYEELLISNESVLITDEELKEKQLKLVKN